VVVVISFSSQRERIVKRQANHSGLEPSNREMRSVGNATSLAERFRAKNGGDGSYAGLVRFGPKSDFTEHSRVSAISAR
jgi:hypothetical protein